MKPAEGSTLIGKSVSIRGELSGSEDLFLDGRFEGTINLADSRLTVGPNAAVTADLNVRDLVVFGLVDGNIHAPVASNCDNRPPSTATSWRHAFRLKRVPPCAAASNSVARLYRPLSPETNSYEPVWREIGRSSDALGRVPPGAALQRMGSTPQAPQDA